MNAHPGALNFRALFERESFPPTAGPPRDVLLEVMDLIDLAIILTDPAGQIVYANKAAQMLLSASKAIQQCRGRLKAFSRKSAADLQSALTMAGGKAAHVPDHGIVVPLYDLDGAVEAVSWILPLRLRRSAKFTSPDGRYVMFVTRQLTHESTISIEFFTRCYGLTRAERRLLEMLASGMTILEAGEALDVSANTARTHLRSLFAKTGTHRQAELIRLATTTLPPASLRCA
jgi:DNA-binding CsgD family transcriptional regulator